jgi:N-acetylglutamate synthase-like GNAT family acetyltransferase
LTAFFLRAAMPEDEAAVTVLLEASYGQLLTNAYGQALASALFPVIAKAKPELLASGSYYVAVTSAGQAIGAGGWTRERPGAGDVDEDLGHIRHVATHPDWTGQGVGRALIDHVVCDAKAKGIKRFECYASLNSVDFYTRLGFVKVRPIDIPVGEDLIMPSLLMERTL